VAGFWEKVPRESLCGKPSDQQFLVRQKISEVSFFDSLSFSIGI
jgi:hypothetical protein